MTNEPPPIFKRVQAQIAIDAARVVVARLRSIKRAKTQAEFNMLRNALRRDLNILDLKTQTL